MDATAMAAVAQITLHAAGSVRAITLTESALDRDDQFRIDTRQGGSHMEALVRAFASVSACIGVVLTPQAEATIVNSPSGTVIQLIGYSEFGGGDVLFTSTRLPRAATGSG